MKYVFWLLLGALACFSQIWASERGGIEDQVEEELHSGAMPLWQWSVRRGESIVAVGVFPEPEKSTSEVVVSGFDQTLKYDTVEFVVRDIVYSPRSILGNGKLADVLLGRTSKLVCAIEKIPVGGRWVRSEILNKEEILVVVNKSSLVGVDVEVLKIINKNQIDELRLAIKRDTEWAPGWSSVFGPLAEKKLKELE